MTADIQPMKLRDVCQKYSLADSTLRDWIESEVFGPPEELSRIRIKGRETLVFTPAQIERLERFLRYRVWFSTLSGDDDRSLVYSIIGLLEQIDAGEYAGVIEVLTQIEQTLADVASGVRGEIQSLYAKQAGDAEIRAEEPD
jgi:hypothetical protein